MEKNRNNKKRNCFYNSFTIAIKFVLMSFLLFIFSLKTNAQDTSKTDTLNKSYTLLFELEINAEHFTTDKLQNIYFTAKKNEIIKLTAEGKEQFRYINKTLGQPTYIDATNPFNLLLFYPDYQNVLTLDRTLNLAGKYSLLQLGLFGTNAVGMAGDGNLWLYDGVNFRLKKIGNNGQVVLQSSDLSLEIGQTISPGFILERDQLVYLNDPTLGILVFDVFGKYLKLLPIQGAETIQIIGEALLYVKKGKMYSFHLKTLLQNPVLLPEGTKDEDQIRIEKNRLYVLQKEKLKVYQF